MLNEMLQIPIGRPHRTAEPRRNEDSHRRQLLWMHIQEPEYLWLGKSNGVQHSSRLEVAIFSKFDHHLHAERPLCVCMPRRQPKVAIQVLPHRSHRTIGNNG